MDKVDNQREGRSKGFAGLYGIKVGEKPEVVLLLLLCGHAWTSWTRLHGQSANVHNDVDKVGGGLGW